MTTKTTLGPETMILPRQLCGEALPVHLHLPRCPMLVRSAVVRHHLSREELSRLHWWAATVLTVLPLQRSRNLPMHGCPR